MSGGRHILKAGGQRCTSRDAVGGIPTFVKHFISVLLRAHLKKINGDFILRVSVFYIVYDGRKGINEIGMSF
jgi:hypothetical protein